MNLFILCKIHELGKVRLNDTKLANNEYKLDIFFFFFLLKKKKGLAGAFIVPTHLNPILTWRGAHLGNNEAHHYPNPQLPDLQV